MSKREKTLEVVCQESAPGKVSGSRVGRFLACPSSQLVVPDGYLYSPRTQDALTGSAAHAVIAESVLGREVDVVSICHDYGADPGEVNILHVMALQAWREISQWVPEPRVEFDVDGDLTYGRADVLSTDGESMSIVDWDFGWAGTDKRYQLRAYADAARQMFGMPRKGTIEAFHVLARKGTYNVYHLDAGELDAFRERVQTSIRRCGIDYGPGHDTCKFCPRQLVCVARQDYLRQCVALMPSTQEALVMDDSALARIYPAFKEVKKLVDTFDKMLTTRLVEGAALSLGNGKILTLSEQEYDQIDPLIAWPFMQARLTDTQIAQVLSVGKRDLLDAIAEGAPRGQKGKVKDEFLGELREAGAVHRHKRMVKTEVEQ